MRRLLLAWSRMPNAVRAMGPLLVMAALWWLSSQTHLPGGTGMFASFWHNGAHVVAYAFLGASWLLALPRRAGFPAAAAPLAVVLAELYAVVDELHQSYVPGRDCSLSDAGSDLFGAMLGTAVVLVQLSGSRRARTALPWLLLGALGCVSLATWGP
jgi:VanZ family protein